MSILWDKKTYEVKLHSGQGKIQTDPIYGLIQHLMILPFSKDTVWSMKILDAEGDPIYEIIDHEGRLDDKEGLPVGKDMQQKINIEFFDSTANEMIRLIMKVKER